MDGDIVCLCYGGDMSGDVLFKVVWINLKVQIVDLFVGLVVFDVQGNVQVYLDVLDFNGSLWVSVLVYIDSCFGNVDGVVIVCVLLVVELSMLWVMVGGDKVVISLDLKNFFGKDGIVKVCVIGIGLICIEYGEQIIVFKDGGGIMFILLVIVGVGVVVVGVDIYVQFNDYQVDCYFEFVVCLAWLEVLCNQLLVLEVGKVFSIGSELFVGLIFDIVWVCLSMSMLLLLFYGVVLCDMLCYFYGCIEQIISKGYVVLIMDIVMVKVLGVMLMDDVVCKVVVDSVMDCIVLFQVSNGYFSFWGGISLIVIFIMLYVVDFLFDVCDVGFVVLQDVLQKVLQCLSDDLFVGGYLYYGYEQYDYMCFVDEVYFGFVFVCVNCVLLGMLCVIFDNECSKLVVLLLLVYLGVVFKLMGDNECVQKVIVEVFVWIKECLWYVGDYGLDLCDFVLMVVFIYIYGFNKFEYDVKLIDWVCNVDSYVCEC